MLATYAAALLLVAASVPVGAGVLWLSGRREWSWIAPALGLALLTVAGWLLVRLPGEGITVLIGSGLLAAAGCAALPRLGFGTAQLREAAAPGLLALLAISIPFAVEGHVGILGTGFNVDMSQHLFVAEWIADPLAQAPSLVDQGYPVGPHSLAAAGAALPGGGIVTGFTGVTIAVPVILALTALAATRELGPRRGALAAVLVALPYLVASYLAQGAFKEIYEAAFVVGFALWLRELRGWGAAERTAALPGAVLVAGALYAYSGPGLAWIAATLGAWAAIALLRSGREAIDAARAALPTIAVGLLVAAALIAPEVNRILDFGGSAGNVANASAAPPDAERLPGSALRAAAGDSDAEEDDDTERRELDLFDNQLGNLFGDIPALEMFGVWPSGDFRVRPGDGAVPAPLFYLAALLGAAGLALGLRRALREREDALLAALAAALAIWLAALLLSTPYTTAKALQMVAPLLMLLAVRGVLDPRFSPLRPGTLPSAPTDDRIPGAGRLGAALAAAFVLAVGGSSVLALANAPVGPERYSAGIAKLRELVSRKPVLVLAPADQIADRHGADYYGWELRGADPVCVVTSPGEEGFAEPAPAGIRYVVTIGGKSEAPFPGTTEAFHRDRVGLWEVTGFNAERAPAIAIDPDVPTTCAIEVG